MANPRMTLLDLLSKAEQGADPDFLRDGLKLLAQEIMDAELTQLVGAGLGESVKADQPRRSWPAPEPVRGCRPAGCRAESPLAVLSRSAATTKSASNTMPRLIFDRPHSRSRNAMGSSSKRNPA